MDIDRARAPLGRRGFLSDGGEQSHFVGHDGKGFASFEQEVSVRTARLSKRMNRGIRPRPLIRFFRCARVEHFHSVQLAPTLLAQPSRVHGRFASKKVEGMGQDGETPLRMDQIDEFERLAGGNHVGEIEADEVPVHSLKFAGRDEFQFELFLRFEGILNLSARFFTFVRELHRCVWHFRGVSVFSPSGHRTCDEKVHDRLCKKYDEH